jgi:hypothetical protein
MKLLIAGATVTPESVEQVVAGIANIYCDVEKYFLCGTLFREWPDRCPSNIASVCENATHRLG